MKLLCIYAFILAAVCFCQANKHARTPPKVQIYSHFPGHFGKPNTLICLVGGFHPPDISINLLKGGDELPIPRQTDLSFGSDWNFNLLRSAPFTPQDGEKFLCRVDHGGRIMDYEWDPSM